MMYAHRLLSPFLVVLAAFLAVGTPVSYAQIRVGERVGFADPESGSVLISVTEDENDPARWPATVDIDGQPFALQTTTLPIVRLTHDAVESESFSPSTFTLVTPDGGVEQYAAELRWRGATALLYSKKSYAVKLLDADGADLDASLLGMREDNSWILDAMTVDKSRLRNRATMDMWLDFSTPPYYAATEDRLVNGTRGRFVEVFIGDRYWGLYCLSEKVDRKQLRLKKFKDGTPRGLLYKLVKYDDLLAITDPSPSNESFTWQKWECSYPDVRKGEPIDWQPLFDITTFFAGPDADYIGQHLAERVDLPLWTDYNLFCDLFHGDDNACKNIYAYYRDVTAQPAEPLCICPWDLDATWGRAWDGTEVDPESNCFVVNAVNYHVVLSMGDEGALLSQRWAELRGGPFTAEAVWPYFQRYFDLFATSGAASRETERWSGTDGIMLDFEAEQAYMRQWLDRRIPYLDADYGYDPNAGIAAPTLLMSAAGTYNLAGQPLPPAAWTRGISISAGRKVLRR